MADGFAGKLDVIGINKYMGWYAPWPKAAAQLRWNVFPDKPLVISEFGCEALSGRTGESDVAGSWSEDYQAALYRDNLTMFGNIPNLAGVSPWVLFDFKVFSTGKVSSRTRERRKRPGMSCGSTIQGRQAPLTKTLPRRKRNGWRTFSPG